MDCIQPYHNTCTTLQFAYQNDIACTVLDNLPARRVCDIPWSAKFKLDRESPYNPWTQFIVVSFSSMRPNVPSERLRALDRLAQWRQQHRPTLHELTKCCAYMAQKYSTGALSRAAQPIRTLGNPIQLHPRASTPRSRHLRLSKHP